MFLFINPYNFQGNYFVHKFIRTSSRELNIFIEITVQYLYIDVYFIFSHRFKDVFRYMLLSTWIVLYFLIFLSFIFIELYNVLIENSELKLSMN
jgi:hypothetical protein